MNHTFCPLSGPGLISSHGGVFQGIYRWLIALCQPILSQCGKKWLNFPSINYHTTCVIEEQGRSSGIDRQWLK